MSCDVKKCDITHEMQRLRGRIYLRNWKFIATEGDNTQQICDPRAIMLKVSEHMANSVNAINPKNNIFPFYKMYTENTTLRGAKEKLFINTLKPKLNRINLISANIFFYYYTV